MALHPEIDAAIKHAVAQAKRELKQFIETQLAQAQAAQAEPPVLKDKEHSEKGSKR